ncbi:hypothetical protein KC874_04290 [Candidatus Saccharibacteria bacterium]|nr:hypothetical protein [Candidatus Saccharibacteria bacterium]
MTIIGLKELSQNAGKIAERVAKGEKFTVVKRSKPVFIISAPLPAKDEDKKQELTGWTKQAINKYKNALTELHTS